MERILKWEDLDMEYQSITSRSAFLRVTHLNEK